MAAKIGGLGKGLDAIFMENNLSDSENSKVLTVRISQIEPNRDQPRDSFDESTLLELADSITSKGVLQPLLVRPLEEGRYQIVAGERRWRASRMAGLSEIPVIVKDLDDSEVMEIALIENLQRENLSPIEEANGFKSLIDKYNLTQEEVSRVVGKSRPVIANALRLLNLPEIVIDMLKNNDISVGHAKVLLTLTKKEQMEELAKEVVKKGLSVRHLEQIVKHISDLKNKKVQSRNEGMTIYDEVEISLRECLGRKVNVRGNSRKKGIIQIEFFSEKDLMSIAEVLANIGEG